MRRAIVLCGVSALSVMLGCQTRIIRPSAPFDRDATERCLQHGNAAIMGQAFKKTVGGDVKYAAGNTVFLYPATPYFLEVLRLLPLRDPFTQVQVEPTMLSYVRTTVADGEGRFKFQGLVPCSYYIETTITWGVPGQYGIQTTGGPATGIVNIEGDAQVAEIILQ